MNLTHLIYMSHFLLLRTIATTQELMVEWLSNNYKSFGAKIAFVSDKSQEGSQFCKGFGGIGGIMRYKLDLATLEDALDDNVFDDDGFI